MTCTAPLIKAHVIMNKGDHVYPRLVSVANATTYSATSRAKLYQEMKNGNLKFIKLDGATRIEISEIDRWIDVKSEQSKPT